MGQGGDMEVRFSLKKEFVQITQHLINNVTGGNGKFQALKSPLLQLPQNTPK